MPVACRPWDMRQTWLLPSQISQSSRKSLPIPPHPLPPPALLLTLLPLPQISLLAPMSYDKGLPRLQTTPLWAWFPFRRSAWSCFFLGRFLCINHLAKRAQDGREAGVMKRTGGSRWSKDSARGLTAPGLLWNDQGQAVLERKQRPQWASLRPELRVGSHNALLLSQRREVPAAGGCSVRR